MSAATAEASSTLLALWPPQLAWQLAVASSAALELCHLAQHCPPALFSTALSHIADRLMACLPEVGGLCSRCMRACRLLLPGSAWHWTAAKHMLCLFQHWPLPRLTPPRASLRVCRTAGPVPQSLLYSCWKQPSSRRAWQPCCWSPAGRTACCACCRLPLPLW